LAPQTNGAAARVLERLGIQAVQAANEGCCGALAYHLDAQAEGLERARHNIDALCGHLDQGVEMIVSSASGCGNFIKDYTALLAEDPDYADKAARVSAKVKDLSEILAAEDLRPLRLKSSQ